MLSLLMNVHRKDGLENTIGKRQLAMKKTNSQSWFMRVNKVANLYGLPNSFTILNEPPWDKESWKRVVKRAIADFYEDNWREKLSSLSTLNMINPKAIKFGIPHPCWQTSGYSSQSVKKAISKVRFLTDTLMTGEKINQMYGTSAKCNCGYALEHRFHILLDCNSYQDLRELCFTTIVKVVQKYHPQISENLILNRTVIAKLILDPTWYRKDIGLQNKDFPHILAVKESNEIEVIGRAYCYKIYKRRFEILSDSMDGSDSETETDASYSIHDTEESSDTDWESDYNV